MACLWIGNTQLCVLVCLKNHQEKLLYFRVFGRLVGPMFRSFLGQHRHLDAFWGSVGSDIQKYCVFSSIFDMDVRTYRVFSSPRGLDDEILLSIGPLFGAIL